mgnify:CR=1 FL=1|jgi:hypothetical protein
MVARKSSTFRTLKLTPEQANYPLSSARKVLTNENYLALTQATKKQQRLSAKPVKKRAKKKK